jgi:hypothetical protein
MNAKEDTRMYNMAVNFLSFGSVQGPSGTYHVKNGVVYMGDIKIEIENFSTSTHAWFILH